MIFDEIAEVMNSISPRKISRMTGLNVSRVEGLRNGCPFKIDYNLVCGLNKMGYDIRIVRMDAVGIAESNTIISEKTR